MSYLKWQIFGMTHFFRIGSSRNLKLTVRDSGKFFHYSCRVLTIDGEFPAIIPLDLTDIIP